MNSFVRWAFFPARIFSLKFSMVSWVCCTSVPKRLFFFSPVLSSMITIDTPIRSRLRTVYTKCSVSPPVSPSKMIGFVVTSMMSSIVRKREVMSTSSMSGFPFAVESHRELSHIASNWCAPPSWCTTVFSTIRPVSPSWASIAVTRPFTSIIRRSRPRRRSGIARSARWRF